MSINGLYFMPTLVQALQGEDPRSRLRQAFRSIEAFGQQRDYHEGYLQFLRFMDLAFWEAGYPVGVLQGSSLDGSERPNGIGLQFEKDGKPFATCFCTKDHSIQTVVGARPDHYRISLDTGQFLWAGRLDAANLLWSHAFPGQGLRMAASTDRSSPLFTREIRLLEGAVTVHVQPGLEAGTLIITLNDGEACR
jgi:hypothetical protein